MRGDLADLGVADLLYLLALRHRTGRLSIVTSRILAHLYLARGRLVLATSTDPALRLGQILIAAGAITADGLAEALAEQTRSPRAGALGPLLIERGLATADVVDRALRAQMFGVLVHVLTATDGRFLFQRGVRVPPNVSIPDIDTDLLILESVSAVDGAGEALPWEASADVSDEWWLGRRSRSGRTRRSSPTAIDVPAHCPEPVEESARANRQSSRHRRLLRDASPCP
jgi:Domain of unknown function (DUF4388)